MRCECERCYARYGIEAVHAYNTRSENWQIQCRCASIDSSMEVAIRAKRQFSTAC
jgi:hypothetical protein